MKPRYEHTQPGTLMRLALGGVAVGSLCMAVGLAIARAAPQVVLNTGGLAAFMTVLTFLFHSLHVRVDEKLVRLRFGIGLVRKKFQLADIEQVRPVRSRWYNGWGIKKVRGGWLFNVSGFDAVELKFKNGRRALIGTDEPKKLTEAIQDALAAAT